MTVPSTACLNLPTAGITSMQVVVAVVCDNTMHDDVVVTLSIFRINRTHMYTHVVIVGLQRHTKEAVFCMHRIV